MKLQDMPSVTYRAIVSTSGFTDGAIAKASAHGVELFVMKPCTEPISIQFQGFEGVGQPEQFLRFNTILLCWMEWRLNILAPDGPRFFNYPVVSRKNSTSNWSDVPH